MLWVLSQPWGWAGVPVAALGPCPWTAILTFLFSHSGTWRLELLWDQRLLNYICAARPRYPPSWHPPALGFFPFLHSQGFTSGERRVLTISSRESHCSPLSTYPPFTGKPLFQTGGNQTLRLVSFNLLFYASSSFLQVLGNDRLCFPKWPQQHLSFHVLISHMILPRPHQEVEPNSPPSDSRWVSHVPW